MTDRQTLLNRPGHLPLPKLEFGPTGARAGSPEHRPAHPALAVIGRYLSWLQAFAQWPSSGVWSRIRDFYESFVCSHLGGRITAGHLRTRLPDASPRRRPAARHTEMTT